MALVVFLSCTSSFAVPEIDLSNRKADVSRLVSEKLEIAEFTGSGNKRLGWAKITGDKSLPPIVISVGLGESYIHYQEFFYDLLSNGTRNAVFVFDLRGQGFSERLSTDKTVLHIESFDDYVADLEKFLTTIVRPDYPLSPRIMAHSTGGLVAFRLLAKNPELAQKIVFVAPLFGINYGSAPAWAMSLLAKTLDLFGYHDQSVPFRKKSGLPPFEKNFLTYSPERYARIVAMQEDLPKPESRGPSVGFVVATQNALAASDDLAKTFSIPSVVMTADEDVFVSTVDAKHYCGRMPKCELVSYTNARHVLLHERDEIRNQVVQKIRDFLFSPGE